MQGNPKVIEALTHLLRGELSARDQYFYHSRRYEDLGLKKLYERLNHEMEEETQHADDIMRRLFMIEGKPDMRPLEFTPGNEVPDMLQKDLDTEIEVRDRLRNAMRLCEAEGDYVSRDMLLKQLIDTEEDHAYWLEQQLGLIQKLGLENYTQSQMG